MKRKYELNHPDSSQTKKTTEINDDIQLEKFNFSQFYTIKGDTYICDLYKNRVFSPCIACSRLIAEYYAIKFGCEIGFSLKTSSFQAGITDTLISFLKNSPELMKTENYRKAFLWGMDADHAIPVIYIKEGKAEGIFVTNSVTSNAGAKNTAAYIQEHTKIDVYITTENRQADVYSCYIDALVFARDSTAFTPESKEYYIPDLLTILKSQCEQQDKVYFVTQLPDKLLKTCQLSSFLNYHREKDRTKIIHKSETLTQFRSRYTDKNVLVKIDDNSEEVHTDLYSYPRKKGLKFAEIMRIQFYLNQLNTVLSNTLTQDNKINFLHQAKTILAKVFDSANREQKLQQLVRDFIVEGKGLAANRMGPF